MKKELFLHEPVMAKECLEQFLHIDLRIFIDATIGTGGHAQAFLSVHPEIALYLGCDRDIEALKIAKKRLVSWEKTVVLINKRFSELDAVLEREKIPCVNGILFDLGMSSLQIQMPQRGFSFQSEGPLDMRMDRDNPLTAARIVNEFSEQQLGEIFREFGEERYWKRAAHAVVMERKKRPIETTKDLVQIISKVIFRKGKSHPATRIFQALRIYVNSEMEELKMGLKKAISSLCKGGRIVVLSFHSLEDRLVKQTFRLLAKTENPTLRLVTKKVVRATKEEIRKNPRARSAKLRCAEKI